ncbi:MAG: hypothetical protein MPN21_18180 [Thermoanaerobaculia bacterium]|nr:hypothetical protein [Thermoanaerobaculia bacterium]
MAVDIVGQRACPSHRNIWGDPRQQGSDLIRDVAMISLAADRNRVGSARQVAIGGEEDRAAAFRDQRFVAERADDTDDLEPLLGPVFAAPEGCRLDAPTER